MWTSAGPVFQYSPTHLGTKRRDVFGELSYDGIVVKGRVGVPAG